MVQLRGRSNGARRGGAQDHRADLGRTDLAPPRQRPQVPLTGPPGPRRAGIETFHDRWRFAPDCSRASRKRRLGPDWRHGVGFSAGARFVHVSAGPACETGMAEAQQENRCVQVRDNAMAPFWPTEPALPTRGKRKIPGSSTASLSWFGWKTNRRFAGSRIAAGMPCSAPRTPKRSRRNSSSTWTRKRASHAFIAFSGSTLPTDAGSRVQPVSRQLGADRGSAPSPAQAFAQTGQDQNLAVSDSPCSCLADDGLDHGRQVLLLHKHGQLHLG